MATSTSVTKLISTTAELEAFLSSIQASTTLYLDLEGQNLSRNGSISIITILAHPEGIIGLVDVLSLGESTFTTVSKEGKSLKSILEDPSIIKCFWDVRNDADALWAHYKIGILGVIDIQLLENVSRAGGNTYLYSLQKAIQVDLKLGRLDSNHWNNTKNEIKGLMSSNLFSKRPMETKTIQYCENDVVHLPKLRQFYLGRMKPDWLAKAKEESLRRVEEAHAPGYEPHSEKKKFGPWGSGMAQQRQSFEDMLDQWQDDMRDQLANDFDDDWMMGEHEEYDYDDDGPTSCRDIIDDADYYLYYSD